MDICVPVGMDDLFDRGRRAIDNDQDWAPVEAPEAESMGLGLARLVLSRDIALLRAQYDVDLPISVALTLGQPEVYFSPARPPTDEQVACGIERLIAPGDAIAWIQLRTSPLLQRTACLIGTAQLGMQSLEIQRVRHTVRRDFPNPGCITIAVAPLHPESNAVLEEWCGVKAAVAVMEPHSDSTKSKITEVKQLVRVPIWAVPMAAPMHFKHQLGCIMEYTGSEAFSQVLKAAGSYMVVGIRRCVKGPPLLPRQESININEVSVAIDWEAAEIGGVRLGLPEYFRRFLGKLGVHDIEVYDRLHGRQIVRYQAVVERQSWERCWAVLETPFRIQRAAYRRAHGGSNAPDITIDVEPKFIPVNDSEGDLPPKLTDGSSGGYVASSSSGAPTLPTARTFIHFSDNPTRVLARGDSDPAFIGLDLAVPSGI